MRGEELAEVDVEELVAVEREHGAVLLPPRRSEAQSAATAERFRFADRLDVGTEAGECVDEDVLLAGAAGDDDARHTGGDEPAHGVLGEREAGDGNERLRQSLRRLSQPLRLAARKEQRLHQTTTGDAWRGRPIPS